MKIILLLLFTWFNCFAQLAPFTLQVEATTQTCLGNGSLAFSVPEADQNATIEYKIYLLPETQVPFATTTANTIAGLVAGEYIVTATQTLNGEFVTATATAVINDEAVPLSYILELTGVQCNNNGIITVVVTSGIATFFEIISGPQTRPLQTSPVFENLPPGQYQVRVHNNCNDAYVVTAQLQQVQPMFYIGENFFPSSALAGCETIAVGHNYTNNNPMAWPVTFEYDIYPPGGAAPITVVHSDVWEYGASQAIIANIPFYEGQEYTYDITITDACGNSYTRYGNVIDREFSVDLEVAVAGCGNYFLWIEPDNFVLPFSVNFVSAPADFNPNVYNSGHPVSATPVMVYGTQSNSLPIGSYTLQITDACGKTVTKEVEIGVQVQPSVQVTVNNYCLGTIVINIPGGYAVTGIMNSAPEGYSSPLPYDVSSFISGGQLVMGNLPTGEYNYTLTDGCGFVHNITAQIAPPSNNPTLYASVIPGCTENEGSVMLFAPNSVLDVVKIISAPPAFIQQLPYDASSLINTSGAAILLSLPEGAYTFETIDMCGNIRLKQVNVLGFELYSNNTNVVRNCDSFDVDLQYNANLNIYDSYWLQKFDTSSGTWGHPETTVPFTSADITLAQSAILLHNGQLNYNFAFEGQFRILRAVHYFGIANTTCTNVVYEFEYYDNPSIIAAYSLPCENGLSEVIIEAIGSGNLQYSITQKNGMPYTVHNGDINLFSGLEEALYNFQVTDACNNVLNIEYNPLDLAPFAINGQGFCDGGPSTLSVPFYSFLNYEWWRGTDTTAILSTSNALIFNDFNTEADGGMYYLKITSDIPGSCIDAVLQYYIPPNNVANSGQDVSATICNNAQYNLFAFLEGQYDNGGTWEDVDDTGALTGYICNAELLTTGTYHFKYKTAACNTTDEAIVTLTIIEVPSSLATMVKGTLCEGGDIQLVAESFPNAEYQWTGPNNFSSSEQFPIITNAGFEASGQYTCTVTLNGCGSLLLTVNVAINSKPEFSLSGNTSICSGSETEISLIAENFELDAATYTWYYNGYLLEGVDGYVIIASEPGNYEVIVTKGACENSKSITIVQSDSTFEVVLENGCHESECFISVVNALDLPDSAFEWSGPNGFVAVGRQINITNLVAGHYSVTVTNAGGCTASAFTDILNTACSIPRGISPGDATHNNSFDLSGMGVQHIQIFNRYGLQVYEKAGTYKNEWHGQSDKGELPAGTYYYVLSLASGKQMTGWVYLKR